MLTFKQFIAEQQELSLEDFSVEELQEFMQTEEYEQLDELSKTTLGNYINKAVGGLNGSAHHAFDAGRHQGSNDELSHKSFEKARKRISGVKRAVNKLAEEEQLDELSKGTLASYIPKAAASMSSIDRDVESLRDKKAKSSVINKRQDKSANRAFNISLAAQKLARESEQLDEGGEKHAYRMGLQHGAKGVKKIDAEKSFGIFAKDYHRGYEQGKDSADWHDDKASKAPLSVRAK